MRLCIELRIIIVFFLNSATYAAARAKEKKTLIYTDTDSEIEACRAKQNKRKNRVHDLNDFDMNNFIKSSNTDEPPTKKNKEHGKTIISSKQKQKNETDDSINDILVNINENVTNEIDSQFNKSIDNYNNSNDSTKSYYDDTSTDDEKSNLRHTENIETSNTEAQNTEENKKQDKPSDKKLDSKYIQIFL